MVFDTVVITVRLTRLLLNLADATSMIRILAELANIIPIAATNTARRSLRSGKMLLVIDGIST